jgi:hypothetical protein
MRRALVITGLLALLAAWAGAEQKTCSTRYDEQAKRWLTRCSDGSRSVTTYDDQTKRFYTKEIVPPAKDGKATK